MAKLTKAQATALRQYAAENGPTNGAFGTMNVWKALVRKGLITRSSGPGWIATEITPAGRAVLADGEG